MGELRKAFNESLNNGTIVASANETFPQPLSFMNFVGSLLLSESQSHDLLNGVGDEPAGTGKDAVVWNEANPFRVVAPIGEPTVFACVSKWCSETSPTYKCMQRCPFPGVYAEIVQYLLRDLVSRHSSDRKAEVSNYSEDVADGRSGCFVEIVCSPTSVPRSLRVSALNLCYIQTIFVVCLIFKYPTIAGHNENHYTFDPCVRLANMDADNKPTYFVVLRIHLFPVFRFLANHSGRWVLLGGLLSMVMMGLYESGLLAALLVPPANPLFSDEEGFIRAVGARKVRMATELGFFLQQFNDSLNAGIEADTKPEKLAVEVLRILSQVGYTVIKDEQSSLPAIEKGEIVLVGLTTTLSYWATRLCNVKMIELTQTTDGIMGPSNAVMVMGKHLPDSFVKKLNQNIERNRAIIDVMEKRYAKRIEVDAVELKRCTITLTDAPKKLSVMHLMSTFLAVVACGVAGLIVLLLEHAHKRFIRESVVAVAIRNFMEPITIKAEYYYDDERKYDEEASSPTHDP